MTEAKEEIKRFTEKTVFFIDIQYLIWEIRGLCYVENAIQNLHKHEAQTAESQYSSECNEEFRDERSLRTSSDYNHVRKL